MAKTETYPGGYDKLMERAESRREPLDYAEGEALAPLDTDLAALCTTPTAASPRKAGGSSYAAKKHTLEQEFDGQPALLALHGLVISNLRKTDFPDHAPALFQRIWAEHGDFLIAHLPLRWLVSAITTFGDHGVNEAQRSIGRALMLMFAMIKLYEFERLYSGHRPDEVFSGAEKSNTALPLDSPTYALLGGGLDVAVLTRLWQDARQDAVVRPLAEHLLDAINTDPGTLFRRLRRMADHRRKRRALTNPNPIPVPRRIVETNPARLRWGVAATLNEDREQAICFAAHHLDLGADAVVLTADDPAHAPEELMHHPRISIVIADETVITEEQREKLTTRNARKLFYFNRARRNMRLDWIAMLDTDEFLTADQPVADRLASTSGDLAFLTLPVVEQFADAPHLFRPPADDYGLDANQRDDLYPVFGRYLPDLILGPAHPRIFVRGKIGKIRVGNYVVKHQRKAASNGAMAADLRIAHCHAPSFAKFQSALPRRLAEGYRQVQTDGIDVSSALESLDPNNENESIDAFFDEMCRARPDVLKALAAHDALYEINLDLARKIEKMSQEVITP
ncbi:glycosyltransferase family 2 protein [Cognatishimia sp. SS12]|uniref:glycosyltransferase family 2 protein n=1 Tax=Cognatishimia sp. SS12 TaxID=2979465 RepID=UPI002330FADE|nr:glycosyltransferase family 2 protein [Cognatishimia sp. SS12]MDC0737012.1 glycosyltransferase family 2 protein [Cognatishimia sp. SS12]